MTDRFEIDGRPIGPEQPPYLIAELSGNHNGSLDRARDMIDAAKKAGADAVKLQTYRADTITMDGEGEEFVIRGGLWDGRRLHELYSEAHTPWEWHAPLFDHARKAGITIFSSPFDATAVDLLEDLGAPAYKIASFEAVDLPLIRHAASTGKPMIISTGMADAETIAEAVGAARGAGCRHLALLRCVSGYPAPAEDYNLATLPDMARRFSVPCGLSDHTLDAVTAIAATALGAVIVEKHFTLERAAGGPDAAFSMEPDEFAAMASAMRTAHAALGRVDYGLKPSERGNVQFRRSLYFTRDLEAGHELGPGDVRSIRPGWGLAPKHLDALIGRRLAAPVRRATACRWEHFES
jgi:pseudaminic acid synthase